MSHCIDNVEDATKSNGGSDQDRGRNSTKTVAAYTAPY